MLTSKSCQIAIRALLFLAHQTEDKPVSIDVLHKELKVGAAYLTKVLQPLTKAGFLTSTKGTKGGVKLNKSAKDISIYEVYVLIDGPELLETCALGIPFCSKETPCALHPHWAPIRTQISDMFKATSILDMKESHGLF